MNAPVPCLLERKLVPKVWGGRALERVLGLALPPGESIGETWELYDRPDGASRVRGSELTVHELLQRFGDDLLGRGVAAAPGGRFPLLLKFIDAREALSVQVHPGEEQARAAGDSAKSEAWVVLEAGPRARIIRGLKAGVTRARFESVAHTARVEDLLHAFTPRAGDAISVPSGTVHAIGPDVVLYEIQQNSALTYRLYDWGRPREVHLREALAAVRYEQPPEECVAPEPIPGGGEWLLRTPHFRVRRFPVSGASVLGTEGRVKVLTILAGRGTLGWRSGGRDMPLALGPGDTVLVPAAVGSVFLSPIGAMTILWSEPGEA